MLRCLLLATFVTGHLLVPSVAWSQDEGTDGQSTEVVAEEATEPAEMVPADNAWMLTSAALVLMMTAPGLAMFYGGLVRKKNVLSVLMQCIFLMGMMSVLWALCGYSLAFGGDGKYIGDGEYLLLRNVEAIWTDAGPDYPIEGTIPRLTHMIFQGMFFVITPALICGAFAERMKFSAMAVFCAVWGLVVYCPLCHMVWDGGWLAFGGENSLAGGALDFAGGTVVHISSGASALICALVLGRRLGYQSDPMPPHNLTYTVFGTALLWVGWFGFNAGSALEASNLAASAFVVTHLSAAAGAIAWPVVEWIQRGKPTVLGACSGAVAGLVCITPASGHVGPMSAIIMGLAAGVVCYIACTSLKNSLGYDDSLDAFGVHGIGGTLGAVLTGVFATRAVNDAADGAPLGLIEGGSIMLGQVMAVVVTYVIAIVVSFILLKVIDAVIGLRAPQEEEVRGLDLTQHGEEGYIFL